MHYLAFLLLLLSLSCKEQDKSLASPDQVAEIATRDTLVPVFKNASYGATISGKKEGYWKYFYPDTSIAEQGNYEAGLKEGWCKSKQKETIRKARKKGTGNPFPVMGKFKKLEITIKISKQDGGRNSMSKVNYCEKEDTWPITNKAIGFITLKV